MLGGVSESKLIPGLTHGPEPHSHCGQTGHQAFETVGEKGPILAFEKGCVGDKDSIRRRLDGTEEHAALECVVPLRAYLWIARSIHHRPWDPFLRERTARTRTGTVFSCNPSCLLLLPRRVCCPLSISQPVLLTFICIAMCFGDMVRDELLGCVGFGILSVIWSAITWKRVIGRAAMKRERRAKLDRVVESVTRAVKATNETKR